MKLKHVTTAAVAAAALVLAATASASAAQPVSKIVWNGTPDKVVAANIDAVQNTTRTNASGDKITSNAHSADFPGIYFIWDSKQKDNGYLKVDADLFDKYLSFTLTSKESNTYWDFVIAPVDGQAKTADNCYVFYIPKVYNNKNINMVFIGSFVDKPDEPDVVVNIGFIGYYLFDGNPLSTSPFWIELNPGECLDWGEVAAGYDAWYAQGGLENNQEEGWQTSGPNPNFWQTDDKVCYEDFTEGQLEGYYLQYYMDPGYKLPPAPVNLGFIGHYLNNDNILNTSFFWYELLPDTCVDADAVEAAYAAWLAQGGLEKDDSGGWDTSGYGTKHFATIDVVCYEDFTPDMLEGYYGAYYIATDYILPVEVNVGFVGWYLDANDIPRQTSIHWQSLLKKDDCINWEAVNAAYAVWQGKGGLEPGFTFKTSGSAPKWYDNGAEVCYGDLLDGQLENYYLTHFMDAGWVLPE